MTGFEKASELCRELDARRVPYVLNFARPEALMVSVAIPGERWELEFFEDGHIELERFVSTGVEADSAAAAKLLGYLDES
ncbi:MAG: hypothetical protein ACLPYW_10140 [Acidimicrobiales bacterium]